MSHANKNEGKVALCSHISNLSFIFVYRAKPATEMQRSEIEVHGRLTLFEVHGRLTLFKVHGRTNVVQRTRPTDIIQGDCNNLTSYNFYTQYKHTHFTHYLL